MIDDTHYNEMDKDLSYETIVLVSRGDDIPKKNYEKKKHPTYEVTMYINHSLLICTIIIAHRSIFKDIDSHQSIFSYEKA
jgi:hypothetical protein